MKNKGGQPSKYPKINLKQVEKLAGYGLIEKEIADIIGIGASTLTLYKVEHPEFLATIKRGKLKSDMQVVKSLYKRAIGYKFKEIHLESIVVGDNETPALKKKTIIKEIAPDVTAQIYWTKNRRPQDWRDRQDFEHTFKKFLYEDNQERSNEAIQQESIELAEAIMSKRKGIRV